MEMVRGLGDEEGDDDVLANYEDVLKSHLNLLPFQMSTLLCAHLAA